MSDERFDQDLRSILAEDAPREVPDDLRRRAAAVSAADPQASRRSSPAWRSPLRLSFGALVVALVVVAIGVWRLGQAPGLGVGATPSPASTPSASPGAACLATEIDGRILGWQGAAGSRIADVEITNISDRSCLVSGTPEVQMVDAAGQILLDSTGVDPRLPPSDATFELVPGARLRTEVQASNYCGPDPSLPIDIAFTLPGPGGRFVAAPAPGVSSDMAVPPCMGTTGGAIEMNGWRR